MKIVPMPRIGLLAFLVAASGCAEVRQGPDVKVLQDFQIKKGTTTQADLIAHLGQPGTTTTQSDGTELLTWSGVHGGASSGDIALATLTGGMTPMHIQSQSCSLQVTVKDGIVIDFTRTNSNQNQTW